MPKVSVIIPIYNTEKYLRKCLDSVCNQTLSDIEIICVNDCSTDNSLEIIEEYASKDDRIKVVDLKENKGAGCARNIGIDMAQGEYLGFVDPDDFIDLEFYRKLYSKALVTNSDVAKGTINLVFDDVENVSLETKEIAFKEIAMMEELHEKISQNKMYFRCMFTTAVYNKTMIDRHNIRFIENCVCGEDLILPLSAAVYANKIEIVNDAKYFYLRRNNSATTSKNNEKKIESHYKMQKHIIDFLNEAPVNEEHYKYIVQSYIPISNKFEIINFYNDNKFDLMENLICIHKSLKYYSDEEKDYIKMLNIYTNNKDIEKLISYLKILRNKLLLKKIREGIKIARSISNNTSI